MALQSRSPALKRLHREKPGAIDWLRAWTMKGRKSQIRGNIDWLRAWTMKGRGRSDSELAHDHERRQRLQAVLTHCGLWRASKLLSALSALLR